MSVERATHAEALFFDALPWPFAVFRAWTGGTDQVLLAQEATLTRTMTPSRLATFTSGRAAAGAALEHLGVDRRPLMVLPGGAPRWPKGVIGSITHTDRIAYAVVAIAGTSSLGDADLALGLDLEDRGRVGADIVSTIMTHAERLRWERLAPDTADELATVTFTAKEALYKAQHSFTSAWLGFEDVELGDLAPEPQANAAARRWLTYDLTETDLSPLDPRIERPFRGRSLVSADEVISAVVLRRQSTPARSR